MTTVVPALCFACQRLRFTPDAVTGTAVATSCRAYPDGIPFDITLGADHRTTRGDEHDGLVFEQFDDDEARQAFADWHDTFATID